MIPRPGGQSGRGVAAIAVLGLLLGGGVDRAVFGREPAAVRLRGGAGALERPAALIPFFERLGALEGGQVRQVRVLWLGDSHIAADLLTGRSRRLVQARFGDGGPGLVMPGNPWRYFHHDRAMSRGDGGFETVGLARDVVDPFVGLWGVALSPRGEGSARLEASFAGAEVAVLAPAGEGCLSVEVDGVTAFGGDVGEAVDGASTPCARVDGSVRAWSRRGLAARDLVHSSRGGYEKVAEGLVDRLLRAYDAYRRAEAKR